MVRAAAIILLSSFSVPAEQGGESSARPAGRPNILWLTSEDNHVSWVGCYGNPHAETPNIDRLAEEGFRYLNCYANAPVCAPSRSTWITGLHALSTGTHHMRSRNAVPHDRIPYYPDLLKQHGYYVGNDRKTDFNIGGREDGSCWDNPGKVDWEALKEHQPFFQIINTTQSHESKAHGSVENTEHNPADVRLRSYHPDLPDVRKTYAKYHDAVKRMDADIGAALQKLEEMGLAEDTVVIYNSDHGGVMPRSKRYLFNSGLHCPLIVRIPQKYRHLWPAGKPGSTVDRLVSFIDMPKTWLSLAGSPAPHMQGLVFLGEDAEPESEFHFAFRGRMDARQDNARAVCGKRFLYIRNYMPYVPWMQHLRYLWKIRATAAWEEHVKSGQATELQRRFFAPKGFTEEFYDMQADPDCTINLVGRTEHRDTLNEMRAALRKWQLEIRDAGLLPESEMVKRAAEHDVTVYEMVRNPDLYTLPALLDAADLALEKDRANLPALRRLLKSPDAGIRYWGITGCFLLNDAEQARERLSDESHEVRCMAAWLMINTGHEKEGYTCLRKLLEKDSPAALTVLNIIDWMGEEGRPLMPAVKAFKTEQGRYPEDMRKTLLEKFNAANAASSD
jgi:arylsulfatase A-like enzyme